MLKKRNKVLISIDHKWRDLPCSVYLGVLLEKNNFIVKYCRNGLEKFYIQGFRPNIVVVNHLYDKDRQNFFKEIAKKGIKVIILPTEGIPTLAQYREFAAGVENNLSGVALHFLWNRPMLEITKKNKTISVDKLKVIGVPRFDFYREPLKNILMPKEEFLKKYNLKKGLPIVTFATNFTQSQFYVKNQKFFEKDSKKLGYNKILKNLEDKETIPQKDFKSREIAINAFIALVKDFKNVNFVLKLHPSEEHTFYFQILEKELKCYHDRVAIIVQEYIWDVLNNTDIELSRSCTTAIESWILGIPTIEMKLNENEWYFSPEHTSGSDIVTNYNMLKERIEYYLNGGKIENQLLENRKKFIDKWCYNVDGYATKRAMLNIINCISTQTTMNIKINILDVFIFFLLEKFNYKIHDIKLYGIKSLFYNINIDKLGRLDKYFHHDDIKKWKFIINKVGTL